MSLISQTDINLILQAVKNAVGSKQWAPAYQAILSALTETYQIMDGPEITSPIPGVTSDVLTWIEGAAGVNSDNGAFDKYIREYTANQYLYRSGDSLDKDKPEGLQKASNTIAENFVKQFLFNDPTVNLKSYFSDTKYAAQYQIKVTLPTLSEIGGIDAAGAAAAIFTESASSTGSANSSPWAGTVLFTQLGDPEFFDSWILQMSPNKTQYGSKIEGGTYDLIAAAEDTTSLDTIGNGHNLIESGQLGTAVSLLLNNQAVSDANTVISPHWLVRVEC